MDRNGVCAVVVSYNAADSVLQQFAALRDQVREVVIVDNGSGAETQDILRRIQAGDPDRVQVVFNETNLGVGAAQNTGLRRAVEDGFEWVLLLDHDSVPEDGMVARMLQAYGNLPDKVREETAILAPRIADRNVRTSSKFTVPYLKCLFRRVSCTPGKVLEVLTVIASGSLIRVVALKRLGEMREDFFIDYIDTEFSLRAVTSGFRILVVCDAVLHHALGERRAFRIAGITMKPTFHSAERRYYIFRNRIRVLKAYGLRIPSFVVFDFVLMSYDMMNIILFEPDKSAKLKMICRGIRDGLAERCSRPADQG